MAASMDKRDFLRTSAAAGLGFLLGDRVWARYADMPADQLAGDESFLFADAVAVALAGVVPFLTSLVEAEPASFREALFAAGSHAALLGDGLRVGDPGGQRLVGNVFRLPGRLVALRLQRRVEVADEGVERSPQDVIERHRSNRFSYLTMNRGGRTIPITRSRGRLRNPSRLFTGAIRFRRG